MKVYLLPKDIRTFNQTMFGYVQNVRGRQLPEQSLRIRSGGVINEPLNDHSRININPSYPLGVPIEQIYTLVSPVLYTIHKGNRLMETVSHHDRMPPLSHNLNHYAIWALGGLLVALGVVICAVGIPTRYDELVRIATLDTLAQSLGFTAQSYAAAMLALDLFFVLTWTGIAAFVFWRKRYEGRMIFFALTIFTVGIAEATFFGPTQMRLINGEWQAPSPITVPAEAFQTFSIASFLITLYMMPNGRFVPPWTRVATLLWAALTIVWFLFPDVPLNQNYGDTWDKTPELSALSTVFFIGSGVIAQVQRYRRSMDHIERQQIKWVVVGFVVAYVGGIVRHMPPSIVDYGGVGAIILMAFVVVLASAWPVCLAVAILRYRLWDIDILINRALVYSSLTAIIAGIYVLIVGSLSAMFQTTAQTGGNLLISLFATGLVAVLFQPIRDRLQRGVNRLMFGERDDPYGVLARLGQRLEASGAPDTVLSGIVETITQALKLPYAAIEYDLDGLTRTGAISGKPARESIRLPLVYQSETVGQLVVAPRTPGEKFSPPDQSLLENIARQAGAAVYTVRLHADLQRSRQRLVTAREEERRRLRRDLHDGLGPTLAAHTLKIGSARALYEHDPATANQLLAELESDLAHALADIRRLVYNLRPPALDQLGLVGAIRDCAAQYHHANNVQISVDAPEELPPLPAAVEVAAYRIVQEALTNVVKHAQARTCRIQLSLNGGLQVTVTDDGVGLPKAYRAGVGLASMQERAAELGGRCTIEPALGRGTQVYVCLPVSHESAVG